MIKIQELTKSFGAVHAVSNVTFAIAAGRLCGVVGPNGAGKSTIFKMIMGLLEPDAGTITIAGKQIQYGDTAYKRLLGYCPEEPVLYEYLTGAEFLHFIAAAKKIPKEKQVQKWLDFFQLTAKADELIRNYSHGMRRKISLSAALLGDPKILLLDEATNGLDPECSFHFKEYLKDFCKAGGTVLFSTHIIEMMEHLCDQMIIVNQGQILRELRQDDWQGLRASGSSLEQLFMRLIHIW